MTRRPRVPHAVALAAVVGMVAAGPPGSLPVAGQTTSQQAAPPAFRAGVDYVEVDVTVTDAQGNPVRDLGPDDFELFEDGARQRVAAFVRIELPVDVRAATVPLVPEAPEPDVQSNDAETERRVFVVVLDDLHTHPLRSERAKEVARNFIAQYVGPRDLVAVIHTGGQTAGQEFTDRRSRLDAAIDRFIGNKLRSGILERLAEYQRQRDMEVPTRADPRLQDFADPLQADRLRRSESVLETLQRLGDLLGDARGPRRKTVVLISEGLDYSIENSTRQTSSGLSTFTSMDAPSVLNRYKQMITAMRRANIAVYAIDPRGLATSDDEIEVGSFPLNPLPGLTPTTLQDEVRRSQDTLRIIAEETGGVAAVTSNNFSPTFDRIIRDNSSYYVLAYEPLNKRRDGRYRTIDVRMKREGLQVRARSGYRAPSADDSAVAAGGSVPDESSPVLRRLLSNPLPINGIPLRAFAVPFKGAGSTGSVMVGLEVDARNFGFTRDGDVFTDRLEAVVVPYDQNGKFLTGDRHVVDLRLRPETYESVRAHGMRLLFRVNLRPGRYQLRAAAHELGSSSTGSVHYDLEVPDFSREPWSLSGLVLGVASAAAMPTPRPDRALAALMPEPPTAIREFEPADTLAVAFVFYQNSTAPTGTIDVTATMREEQSGRVEFNGTLDVSGDDLRNAPDGYGYLIRIPLAATAPGSYVVRLEARSRLSSDRVVVREIPFDVRAAAGTAR